MYKRKVLSDKELVERLICMDLMKDNHTVNEDAMSTFSRMFSGLYIWDFKCSTATKKESLASMLDAFDDLEKEQDYQGMYLLLALRYDQIMKPLPDPVWWLMCSPKAVEGFMQHFCEHIRKFMANELKEGV